MKIAVPRETASEERRVSLVPDSVGRLKKEGHEVMVEAGAGTRANFLDAAYSSAGASIVAQGSEALLGSADIVVKVARPTADECRRMQQGAVCISFFSPHQALDVLPILAERKITALSMDLVPRVTRAQSMDALSSMSTLAGYKAVLIAASALPRILPMLTTAAGTLAPARILVIGAGVAGLQAIATARRLGAIVLGFDIRPATKEQVQSLGATFLEADLKGESTEGAGGYARELSSDAQTRALETIRGALPTIDAVITTALVPGKPAPRLITSAMVEQMRPGSVIVDIAAEAGGNCELTRPGSETVHQGVTVIGPLHLASSIPYHASQMYSKNVATLLQHLLRSGAINLDLASDPIAQAMCVTHGGSVVHEAAKLLLAHAPEGARTT
ncbi:MAG TPA: Re/Si-specific NAD(P)(+) transhydrogenase subunit alpha [Planctomycetota bacterium]|nr:Re/Si-specific NAD(P)(+) transhydrogenase subunit alpha [Planctomycetota bacterium]